METLRQIFEKYLLDPESLARDVDDIVSDHEDCLSDMRKAAKQYHLFSQLAALAEERFLRAKDHFEFVEESCKRQAREALMNAGIKVTEGPVEEGSRLMAVYQKAKRDLTTAKIVYKQFIRAEKSISNRLTLLQSINSRVRRSLAVRDEPAPGWRYSLQEAEEEYRRQRSLSQ